MEILKKMMITLGIILLCVNIRVHGMNNVNNLNKVLINKGQPDNDALLKANYYIDDVRAADKKTTCKSSLAKIKDTLWFADAKTFKEFASKNKAQTLIAGSSEFCISIITAAGLWKALYAKQHDGVPVYDFEVPARVKMLVMAWFGPLMFELMQWGSAHKIKELQDDSATGGMRHEDILFVLKTGTDYTKGNIKEFYSAAIEQRIENVLADSSEEWVDAKSNAKIEDIFSSKAQENVPTYTDEFLVSVKVSNFHGEYPTDFISRLQTELKTMNNVEFSAYKLATKEDGPGMKFLKLHYLTAPLGSGGTWIHHHVLNGDKWRDIGKGALVFAIGLVMANGILSLMEYNPQFAKNVVPFQGYRYLVHRLLKTAKACVMDPGSSVNQGAPNIIKLIREGKSLHDIITIEMAPFNARTLEFLVSFVATCVAKIGKAVFVGSIQKLVFKTDKWQQWRQHHAQDGFKWNWAGLPKESHMINASILKQFQFSMYIGAPALAGMFGFYEAVKDVNFRGDDMDIVGFTLLLLWFNNYYSPLRYFVKKQIIARGQESVSALKKYAIQYFHITKSVCLFLASQYVTFYETGSIVTADSYAYNGSLLAMLTYIAMILYVIQAVVALPRGIAHLRNKKRQ